MLTGKTGELVRERGQDGRTIPAGQHQLIPPTPGDDLVLTLDRNLQYVTEHLLVTQVESVQAKGGMVVVMDTASGDVLAMANARRNPDTGKVELSSANLAAVDTYEPGSVAKIVTAAAALQEGVANPQSTWMVPPREKFSDHIFTDAEPHPTEPMTLAQIIAKSSNIGTMTVSKLLGADAQSRYMRAFGFGERSNLGFPGEAKGILKPADKWQGTERYTVAYGQGVAVTAVQLAAAMNTIANGGTYVSPRLVQATIGRDGKETAAPAPEEHQVLSKPVADEMNRILREVVCRRHGQERHQDRRLHRGRQDRDRLQGHRPGRLRGRQRPQEVLRQLRRLRPGRAPAPHRPRVHRRAARLGRALRRPGRSAAVHGRRPRGPGPPAGPAHVHR